MGQITPNISIYIPNAGETNYDASFSNGMINIDQHDHSGPPNKGVPIASSGLAAGAVTFDKLNANVADVTTGIGTSLAPANQLILLGILPSIYNNATATGFLAKNGTVASAYTLTSNNVNRLTIISGDGSAGTPLFNLPDYPQLLGVNGQGGTFSLQAGGVTQANVLSGLIDLSPNDTAINTFNATIAIANTVTTNVLTISANQKWLITAYADGAAGPPSIMSLVTFNATDMDVLPIVINASIAFGVASPNVTLSNNTGGNLNFVVTALRLS